MAQGVRKVAKKKEIAINKLLPAKADYEFGFMTPIFLQEIKDGSVFVESLDKKVIPELLKDRLESLHEDLQKEVPLYIKEHGHIWIVGHSDHQFMIRKVRKSLRVYDCEDVVPIEMPTLDQVADWHDLSPSMMKKVAKSEHWHDNRQNRYREMDAEKMALLREQALDKHLTYAQENLDTLTKMKAIYDHNMAAGKAIVTTRDVVSVIGMRNRIARDLTTVGQAENKEESFLKLLIDSGLATITPVEVVEAEVVEAKIIEEN